MKIYFLFLLLIFVTGCAVHNPMSEMVMFKQKGAIDERLYSSKYSHALVGYSNEFYPVSKVNAYTRQKYGAKEDGFYDYNRIPLWTTHLIFLSDKVDEFAVSLAIGPAVGADFTAKLFDQIYLTAAFNVFEALQGKVILQHRLLDGNPVGLSIGATVGRNYQIVDIEAGCFCFISEEYYTNTAGLRFVLTSSPITNYGTARPFLYMTGSVNYDFNIKVFYPQIGFSVGIY